MSFSLEAVRTLEEQGFSQIEEAFFLRPSTALPKARSEQEQFSVRECIIS